jgi:hypothetical protein
MGMTIIRNHQMLNPVQHDNRGEFSVTLNLFQGLMNTDTFADDYALWNDKSNQKIMDREEL